ncbi:M48 family metallopeptidase [Candidatus Protochlamydia phocaeensis]|uniref:M48 family metallopeptidase n=1 Tax=Candidatus Protochlamydia phocaeensis TaxID=1414722 RepID=UPI000837CCDB|nr:M48 family metallopeptidase [Candidatus Protochlamydia phocaeensis]
MGLFDDSGNEPRRRGGGGIFLALIIAAVGFLMYMTQTEQNPITGEKQHISLTPEQEIKLGLQSAPEMAAQMGGEIPASDPRTQEVRKIGQEILGKSIAHKGPWRFQFHLLADPKTINAFALPGGQVFITLGLFNRLQTEGQLAGVLSHEMGHVIERHAAQQMAKGQLGQILVMATGVGASDSQHPGRGYQAAMIANVVNQMTQLRYGRKDELEADQWGLQLMTEAGYNPEAMIQVMEILEKAVPGGHTPEMLLTHPYPEHRIEAIKAYLEKHPASKNLKEGASLKPLTTQSSSFSSDS